MTFLKELKENGSIKNDYYRIRNNNQIELGHHNERNEMSPDILLIVNPNAMLIDNKEVFRCVVKYFNFHGWTWKLDEDILDQINDIHAHNILVQFDIKKLLTDEKYYKFFMEELLKETRVNKYLQAGAEDAPEKKCGDYIGYVDYNEKGELEKKFDVKLGEQCHYLPEKIKERNAYRKSQIKKLKQERDNLNKEIEELENKYTI